LAIESTGFHHPPCPKISPIKLIDGNIGVIDFTTYFTQVLLDAHSKMIFGKNIK